MRAVTLIECIEAERAHPEEKRPAAPVSSAERERRYALLTAEIIRNPGTSAEAARRYLEVEIGTEIPKGTFYGGYWNPALDRLPEETRRVQREMRVLRPGGRKVDLKDRQRAKVRQIVAVLKRDCPGFHQGQMMDEVRRITGYDFQDPAAFRRNYIDRVDPAPPETGRPSPVITAVMAKESPTAQVPPSEPVRVQPVSGLEGQRDRLLMLLTAADPHRPAEISDAPDGLAQIRLNLRPMKWSASHSLMSNLHTAMADLMEEMGE
jgi:hypothetical protein